MGGWGGSEADMMPAIRRRGTLRSPSDQRSREEVREHASLLTIEGAVGRQGGPAPPYCPWSREGCSCSETCRKASGAGGIVTRAPAGVHGGGIGGWHTRAEPAVEAVPAEPSWKSSWDVPWLDESGGEAERRRWTGKRGARAVRRVSGHEQEVFWPAEQRIAYSPNALASGRARCHPRGWRRG